MMANFNEKENDPSDRRFIDGTRVRKLCCAIIHNETDSGKTRIHTLAVKLDPGLVKFANSEAEEFRRFLIDTSCQQQFNSDDLFELVGMIAIDRIRARSAWSQIWNSTGGSVMDMSKISINATTFLAEKFPFAFYMTTVKCLKGIYNNLLMQGGRYRSRSCNFFSAFPPIRKAQAAFDCSMH